LETVVGNSFASLERIIVMRSAKTRESNLREIPEIRESKEGKPFPPNTPIREVQLWDDQYITFSIVRSGKHADETLKRDGRKPGWTNFFPLIREDLLPYLDSYRIGFGATYGSDDRYYVTAKYFFPDEDGKNPAAVARAFREILARATANGVHGTFRVLTVTMGQSIYSAENFDTPSGMVEAGSMLKDMEPREMAGMIDWMDRTDPVVSHVTDGFMAENLRQFPSDTEFGRAMRYGILLGLQSTKDELAAKAGATDTRRLRARVLMDFGVDIPDAEMPV
jgi:hypothetical protein